ncbi:MAG: flagellar FliJ family protein [Phycisphaerales bacterium]|nr:flagellar FliJ family protein [Phycisphaerales bacterium]
MAKFIFKLEAVLDQRIAIERQKQLVVAQIERERLDAEEDIRAHQRAIERERDELRDMLASEQAAVDEGEFGGRVVNLAGARFQAAAAIRLTARAQQAVLRLAGIHRRLDTARLDLLHAATQRKAVELLREKQYGAWRMEQNRKDAAGIDEIAIIRAGRADRDRDGDAETGDGAAGRPSAAHDESEAA